MKTSLKFLALFFAASLPATFAAEIAGLPLPVGFNPMNAFAGFVIALALLTAFSDYSRSPRARSSAVTVKRGTEKAAHPLAA